MVNEPSVFEPLKFYCTKFHINWGFKDNSTVQWTLYIRRTIVLNGFDVKLNLLLQRTYIF